MAKKGRGRLLHFVGKTLHWNSVLRFLCLRPRLGLNLNLSSHPPQDYLVGNRMFKAKITKSVDDELLSSEVFEEVFHRLHLKLKAGEARGTSFVLYPELTLEWILRNKKLMIDIIRSEIKKANFEFDTIKHSIVVTDKARDIYIAAWPERILLMAMGAILTRRITPLLTKNVYSFQKGRGPHEAVRDVTEFIKSQPTKPLYVLKRDISKYGDSVPQAKLFEALETIRDIKESPLFLRLLKAAIRTPFRQKDGAAEASLCVGIPSGSPLVPPLENFYLMPLDRKLSDIENSFYGRYGDDILFVTSDRRLADWAREEIDRVVSDLSLEIKAQKVINARLDFYRRLPDDDYEHKTHVAWLGFSLTNHGRLGIKENHLEIVLNSLKKEIAGLFHRAKLSRLSFDDQKIIISNGLKDLLKKNTPHLISAYLYYHSDHVIYKLIDKRVTELVFGYLVKDFGLKKKVAWKTLRSLKIPSVYYQRFLQNRRADKMTTTKTRPDKSLGPVPSKSKEAA